MMDFGFFKNSRPRPFVTKQENKYIYHASISRLSLVQEAFTIRFMQDNHDELGEADVALLQQEMSEVIHGHHGHKACHFSWVKDTLIVRGDDAPNFLLRLMQSDYLDRLACDEIKRLVPDQSVPNYPILHL